MVITAVVIAGVLLWGTYLAVGAFKFNHDIRKSTIVFACTLIFLAGWLVAIAVRQRTVSQTGRDDRPAESPADRVVKWNRGSVVSLLGGLASMGLMALAATGTIDSSSMAYRWMLLGAMVAAAGSLVAALIGLSSPIQHGRAWAWLGILLLVLAMIIGVIVEPL